MKKYDTFYCIVDEYDEVLSAYDGGALAWYSRKEAETVRLLLEKRYTDLYRVIKAKVCYATKFGR